MTNQGDRQAAFRALSDTTGTYNEDSFAAFLAGGATATNYNGAFLEWLNSRTLVTDTNLSDAMARFAQEVAGVDSWDQVNDFTFNANAISGLQLWLDADDADTIAEVANAVSQWDDKSGKGNHVTQGTGSKQPSINVNTLNGRNVVSFDGTDDYLQMASALEYADSWTVFIVLGSNTTKSTATLMGKDTKVAGDTAIKARQWNGTNNLGYTVSGTSDYASTIEPSTTRSVIMVQEVADEVVFTVDGTSDTINSINTKLQIQNIGRWDADVECYDGDIAEIIVYNRTLTAAEITRVENYLNYKWNEILNILSPALWFDGSDADQFTISGGKITDITDKGSDGADATQANTALQFTYDSGDGKFGSLAAEGKMTFNSGGHRFIGMGFKFDFSQRASGDGGILSFNGVTGSSTDRKPLIFYRTAGGNKIDIQWYDSGGSGEIITFEDGTDFTAGDYLNLVIYDDAGTLTVTLNGTTKTSTSWSYDVGTGTDQIGDFRSGWTKIEYSQIFAFSDNPNKETRDRLISFIDDKSF